MFDWPWKLHIKLHILFHLRFWKFSYYSKSFFVNLGLTLISAFLKSSNSITFSSRERLNAFKPASLQTRQISAPVYPFEDNQKLIFHQVYISFNSKLGYLYSFGNRHFPLNNVDSENFFSLIFVWWWDIDQMVKSPRSQKCLINDIRSVCSGYYDYLF